MPLLLLALLLSVLGYLFWKSRTTTLTRNCRWRLTERNCWKCMYCGAETQSASNPKDCLNGGDSNQPH